MVKYDLYLRTEVSVQHLYITSTLQYTTPPWQSHISHIAVDKLSLYPKKFARHKRFHGINRRKEGYSESL